MIEMNKSEDLNDEVNYIFLNIIIIALLRASKNQQNNNGLHKKIGNP